MQKKRKETILKLEKGSELFIKWPQGLYELGLVTREELEANIVYDATRTRRCIAQFKYLGHGL